VDYLEGLLLGVQWSDTDFENRRHVSSLALYGVLVNLLIAMGYFTGTLSAVLKEEFILKTVFFLILFFACPFICFRYYRYPIWVKLPILAVQACKQVLLTLMITSWVLPRITVSSGDIQKLLMDYLNSTLETWTAGFEDTAGTFATVLGVITGGVYVVFVFIVAVFLALIIPGTLFFIVRMLQLAYDKLVAKLILSDYIDH
jgi:hypothetical protein